MAQVPVGSSRTPLTSGKPGRRLAAGRTVEVDNLPRLWGRNVGEGTGHLDPRADVESGAGQDAESVVGRWAKARQDGCQQQYPDVIEFFEGTYLGTKGPGQGFLVWDAGIYKRLTPDRIRIQIATDELVTYQCSVTADLLTVLDPDGCCLEYRRVADFDDGPTDETEEHM